MSSRGVYEADHAAFRDSVARYLAAEAVPHYEDWDAKGGIPSAFWDKAAELGFVGLAEADDPRFAAVALEEAMAAGLPAVALAMAVHDSFALPLLAGHPARLAAVVEGPLQAEARDGGWVLTGSATTVLNSLLADVIVVPATTDEGSALFSVSTEQAGLQRSPAEPLLGLDALDVADLRFDAASAEPLTSSLESARPGYQLALAVAAMAGARTALAMTVDYVKQRKAFGRPIAEFENTRVVLSALGARITAVGSYVDSCLADSALTPAAAGAAKLCACDLLAEAVDTGVQLHGGYGYMWEYPISRAYAAARFFRAHGNADTSTLAAAIDL